MDYAVYKLEFSTGVHFGNGMLNDSVYVFQADQLFSALYIEAIKTGNEEQLLEAARSGGLLFSDALPYVGERYLIPKPVRYIETERKGNSSEKKQYKRLKYIEAEKLSDFFQGKLSFEEDPMEKFGVFAQQTMAFVRNGEETLPFRVGTYYFHEGNGLYLIAAFAGQSERTLFEELLESLSLTGIGGKKASGLGKFTLKYGKINKTLEQLLRSDSGISMLISCALPREEELEQALEGASYLLQKRSGFIASDTYSDEQRKKRDLYVFAAGSCFENRFAGDVYDVSENGRHAVFRYAKPLFLGVAV